jgi:hypothetical protein
LFGTEDGVVDANVDRGVGKEDAVNDDFVCDGGGGGGNNKGSDNMVAVAFNGSPRMVGPALSSNITSFLLALILSAILDPMLLKRASEPL